MFQKTIAILCFTAFLSACSVAQTKQQNIPAGTVKNSTVKKKDTIPQVRSRARIKNYEDIINSNFTSQHGLFTVHRYKDSIYFEIPDSIFLRDIMVINRLERAPAGLDMYAGEQLQDRIIQFEKGRDATIRIRYNLLINRATPESEISKAVERSNLNPVVVTFPIRAWTRDSTRYVIDVTKFLCDKNFVNEISENTKLAKSISLSKLSDAHVEYIHAYPINVEISISKNYQQKSGSDPVSMVTHTSFIALPKEPMSQRLFDPRVGYFTENYYAYSDEQQKMEPRKLIARWRLEPRARDRARWQKGELVEPEKPIVIYIDPATPRQWRPYLIQGINDWQTAFEQAGFKNAIIGKEWPENDTTMHREDARYSFLDYFPSPVANAYGPHISDPRSGEIIQTHIGWYHNVMSLLHSWYMIQAGATDPAARMATFDNKLMGQLIRFVSSHEVGHTLGLRHNFGSSSRTPVDSLRSLSYLKKNGHTASIMDYARFNYVAQPEDKIPQQYLFPGIGEYDKWAIEWGYKPSFAKSVEEDTKIVRKWITERTSRNPRLWFGDGETKKTDPRSLTEDLGDNAMKASTYGIRNLKRILPELPAWTYVETGVQENLALAYKALQNQYTRYLNHVLQNIGGVYETLQPDGTTASVYEIVPAAKQKEALEFFNRELFDTPLWLLEPEVLRRVGEPVNPDFVSDMQVRGINSLLDITRLNRISANMQRFGAKALALDEYLHVIQKGVWKELYTNAPVLIDNYRRDLQKSYIGALLGIVISRDPAISETDASSVLRAQLVLLKEEIKQAVPKTTDQLTKFHLMDIENRINNVLSTPKN